MFVVNALHRAAQVRGQQVASVHEGRRDRQRCFERCEHRTGITEFAAKNGVGSQQHRREQRLDRSRSVAPLRTLLVEHEQAFHLL